MARSTAKFISYDVRPAKQSERRILLDFLKIAGDCGLPISDYRYVGMGANRFYDFLLIHRYVGIKDMISLEYDEEMFMRSVFNVPFDFIDVRCESVGTFIAKDNFAQPTIIWLDYDGGISSQIMDDVASLATKLKVGDFCFVTTASGLPRGLERDSTASRLAWFQDELGDVAVDVTLEDVENANFRTAVHKVLITAFKNALTVRRDGVFVPFLQVAYSDSVSMITIGGGLLAPGQAVTFRTHMGKVLPFLSCDPSLYEIRFPHITERERALFDRAVTKRRKGSAEYRKLKSLGFRDRDIACYRDLIRYLPRYFETIV